MRPQHFIPSVFFWCVLTAFPSLPQTVRNGSPTLDGRRPDIIIPNIDDDDRDGLVDYAAKIPNVMKDDDILRVRVKSDAALPEGAVARIDIARPWAERARAFVLSPSDGVLQPVNGIVALGRENSAQNGIVLAVEASDFADADRPAEIEITVRFETKDARPLSEKRLSLAVAPFSISCCLDPVDTVHVVGTKLTGRFVRDLAPLVRTAGAELRVFDDPALPDGDIWMQDAAEIGYATDGRRVMRVALHGNRGEKLDDLFARKFLGRDSGVIRKGAYRGKFAQWIDWFGNLEVSPPVKVQGREFPHGRIYAGTQGVRAMHPEVIRFLAAQDAQGPVLWLDTSWLVIGHVDETVSWVPSKDGSPYRMLLPSPRLAVEILRKAEKDAPGCLLNRGAKREPDKPGEYERPVAEALSDASLMAAQEFVQKKIDGVRRTLRDGLGISEADIIEIPVLFGSSLEKFAGRYDALTPNMVNSLLVGETLIVPDPHGPLVKGRDVLLQAVQERLEPIGCKVLAVDDFYPYHRWLGEVHCGTNATRRPPVGHRF
jgi:protein-arginine deiminase